MKASIHQGKELGTPKGTCQLPPEWLATRWRHRKRMTTSQGGLAQMAVPVTWNQVHCHDLIVDINTPIPFHWLNTQVDNIYKHTENTPSTHKLPHQLRSLRNQPKVQTIKSVREIHFYYFQIQGHSPYSALSYLISQLNLIQFNCQEKPQPGSDQRVLQVSAAMKIARNSPKQEICWDSVILLTKRKWGSCGLSVSAEVKLPTSESGGTGGNIIRISNNINN